MKIVVHPQQKQFSDFVETIHHQFDKGGNVIHKKRNEVRVFDVNGLLVNVKKFRKPRLLNRIIYTFFRLSKAERSFRHAVTLKEKGIGTPEPIAYILTKQGGLLHESYYISRQSAYNRNMYEFGTGGIEGREHIIESICRIYGRHPLPFRLNGKSKFCCNTEGTITASPNTNLLQPARPFAIRHTHRRRSQTVQIRYFLKKRT